MKWYFIFGEAISKEYFNAESFEDFLKNADKDEIRTHCHDDEKETPADLLANYDGWAGYAQITEEEYKLLNPEK